MLLLSQLSFENQHVQLVIGLEIVMDMATWLA